MTQATKIFSFVIIIVLILFMWFMLKDRTPTPTPNDPNTAEEFTSTPISIEQRDIEDEENFTGEEVLITGESTLAKTAQAHVASRLADFKSNADDQVPQMREDFGGDSPVSQYFVQMNAEHLKGATTESLIITEYAYTGGANGMSSYRVFTSSLATGEILELSEIINDEKEAEFIELVKDELVTWRPYEQTETVVFEEDVATLTLEGLNNWALDGDNLILYFSKYEVGPGALGAFEFTIPLSELENIIELN